MASYGRVVGGQYMNSVVNPNRKGDLAINVPLKRSPILSAETVAAWEEIIPEKRGGAAGAMSKVGQAVARAALPGTAGKAASAAVESTVDSVQSGKHIVRVAWVDGKQSLIQLPDQLFQHLAILLADRRIATTTPAVEASEPPPPPGMISQLTKLAGTVRPSEPDVADQIGKLAALRDQGALTEAEFSAKKAELLGLPAPEVQPVATTLSTSPPPPPAHPPAWAPDPHGRYELRYWDGSAWSEHVSRGGVQSVDPT